MKRMTLGIDGFEDFYADIKKGFVYFLTSRSGVGKTRIAAKTLHQNSMKGFKVNVASPFSIVGEMLMKMGCEGKAPSISVGAKTAPNISKIVLYCGDNNLPITQKNHFFSV